MAAIFLRWIVLCAVKIEKNIVFQIYEDLIKHYEKSKEETEISHLMVKLHREYIILFENLS